MSYNNFRLGPNWLWKLLAVLCAIGAAVVAGGVLAFISWLITKALN